MEWTRADLKDRAKFSVKSFYWKSVLVAFILALVSGDIGGKVSKREDISYTGNELVDSVSGIFAGPLAFFLGLAMVTVFIMIVVALVLSVFVFNPLIVGCKKYFLDASDGNADLGNIGYAFRNNYMNVTSGIFLQDLFIFLWSLLFIIPGIYKAYEYRMIPYLLAEDSGLTFTEAKNLSREMMDGEKWDTFVLDLSFILWHLLSSITFGLVGIFWVSPYVQYTNVELYKVLRTKVPGPYYSGDNVW